MRCCADLLLRRLLTAALVPVVLGALGATPSARAGTPLSLSETHAGHVNFTGTAGSLRRGPNTGDACAVDNYDTAVLDGLPAGATVRAAYLYWAGSWSDNRFSTSRSPDWSVTLDGSTVFADRQFTEFYGTGHNRYDYFSGRADVTALVAAKGNGAYTFGNLEVNTARPHCEVQGVLAGWSLIVVYEHAAESNRVVNVFDGFQAYRGGSIAVTADNFQIAAADINGKVAHLTWEGDAENSGVLDGRTESLTFDGHDLVDGLNPAGNQFNSTVNLAGRTDTWGVDFDVYDVTPYLAAGQTSATTVYRSGQDLVLLSAEVISVTNIPLVDLAFTAGPGGPLPLYDTTPVDLALVNNGPSDEPGAVTLTVDLPAEVEFAGTSSPGWTATVTGPGQVTFTHPGPVAAGAALPLAVDLRPIALPAAPVDLTVTVGGGSFDFDPANNTGAVALDISVPPAELVSTMHFTTLDDPVNGTANPKAIPGATVLCTLTTLNLGAGEVDNNGVDVVLTIAPETMLVVTDYPGGTGPIHLADGTPPSGLTLGRGRWGGGQEDVSYSDDGGASFKYKPVPDALGCDGNVTHVRVRPSGTFRGRDADGPAEFSLLYRVLVRLTVP